MAKRKEIILQPGAIIIGLLVIILVAVGAFTVPALLQKPVASETGIPPDPAARAAENGVKAVFTLGFSGGQEAWLAQVCSVSTTGGCLAYRNTFGPVMWASAAQRQADIRCLAAAAGEKVDEYQSASGMPLQVWAVNAVLAVGGDEKSQTVYAVVGLEEGNWKFERFLLPQEAESYTGDEQ